MMKFSKFPLTPENNIKLFYSYSLIQTLTFIYLPVRVLFYSSIGISLKQMFILEMIAGATTLLTDVPLGVFSDKIGHKKSLILGHLFYLFSFFSLLSTSSFEIQCLSMFFFGLGGTFHSGAEDALFYDSFKLAQRDDDYVKIMGRIQLISGIIPVVFLGGILGQYNLKVPFVITSLLYFVLIFISLFFYNTNFNPGNRNEKFDGETSLSVRLYQKWESVYSHAKTSFISFQNNQLLLTLAALYVFIGALRAPLLLLVQSLMNDYELKAWQFGIIQNAWIYVALIFGASVYKIQKRTGTFRLILIFVSIIALSQIIMGLFSSLYSILLIIPIASSMGGLFPILYKKINDQITFEKRATALSTLNTAQQIVFLVLSFLASFMMEIKSQQIILLVFGLLTIMILLVMGQPLLQKIKSYSSSDYMTD